MGGVAATGAGRLQLPLQGMGLCRSQEYQREGETAGHSAHMAVQASLYAPGKGEPASELSAATAPISTTPPLSVRSQVR